MHFQQSKASWKQHVRTAWCELARMVKLMSHLGMLEAQGE